MTAIDRITSFYRDRFSIGDQLAEAFYAVWMAVVSIGIINSTTEITPAFVGRVVLTCLAVNTVWGVIDGVTVMYTNIIERAATDRILYRLRQGDAAAKDLARREIDGSVLSVLGDAERRMIVDALARGTPAADPTRRPYRPTLDDWLGALGIVGINVALAIPIAAPLVFVSDVELAIYVSRIIATLLFATLGWAYARNLNRNPWLASVVLGAIGCALFSAAFAAGW